MILLPRRMKIVAGCGLMLIACHATQPPPPSLPSVQLTPEQLQWQPYSAGGEQAFLLGNPAQPGPYVVRLRFPAGTRIQPHTHPDARVATVISGTMYFSFGEQFDSTTMRAFPAGSVWTELPRRPHYAWARYGDVVLQVSGTGPSGSTPAMKH